MIKTKDTWAKRLVATALFLLLFLSLFKDDQASIARSELFSQLTTNPYILILKSGSDIIWGLLFVVLCASILAMTRPKFLIFPPLYLFLLGLAIATIRSQGASTESSFKTLSSLGLFSILAAYSSIAIATIGARSYREALGEALLAAAVCLICSNLINYATGFGYVANNPRLFGTAAHPNFLGAQLSVSSLIVLARTMGARRTSAKPFLIAVFVGGLFLIKETGSRTSVMMLVVGSFALFWARARFAMSRLFAFAMVASLFVSIFVVYGLEWISGTSFDRGAGATDTRSAAVSEMLDRIADEPIWGFGYFPGASENSYLRGWVAYGVFYEFIFLTVVATFLASAVRAVRSAATEAPTFFSLLVALAFGGILEGYLVDNFSFQLLVWFLSCTGCLRITSTARLSRFETRSLSTSTKNASQHPSRSSLELR